MSSIIDLLSDFDWNEFKNISSFRFDSSEDDDFFDAEDENSIIVEDNEEEEEESVTPVNQREVTDLTTSGENRLKIWMLFIYHKEREFVPLPKLILVKGVRRVSRIIWMTPYFLRIQTFYKD